MQRGHRPSAGGQRGAGLPDLFRSGLERGLGVVEFRWSNDDVTIEVGKHPFGACLGAIDADDAEMLGTDFLHSGLNEAATT